MAKTLADMLGDMPVFQSNTDGKQIEYLPLHELHEDPDNFYSMEGIEDLAANIATAGLLDPLVVYRSGDEWRVLSGHRRRAALLLLAKDEPEKYLQVPCIVDRNEVPAELRELQLILANSGTRRLTSADVATQVERTYDLLYKLQQQGYNFPGKMRAHVAEACQISESRIAKLNAIKNGLDPSLYADYYEGDHSLSESVAYELAKLPATLQCQICTEYLAHSTNGLHWLYASVVQKIGEHITAVSKMFCDVNEKECNRKAKERHIVKVLVKDQFARPHCSKGCCEDCPTLQSCGDVCDMLKSKQAKMKAEAKVEKIRLAAEKDAKERPAKEQISGIYLRFSFLLDRSCISVKDYLTALNIPYAGLDENTVEKRCYSDGVQPTTGLPFDYSFSLETARRLCKAADILGCSIDYLLGRTDIPGGARQ